jgi:hypothetical protein
MTSPQKDAVTSPGARRRSPDPDHRLVVSGFAHIDRVDMGFGDLTVLVGPQASGKSLVLQMLKLAIDGHVIARTLEEYGLLFRGNRQFLARYFGVGLENAWIPGKTAVNWGDREVTLGSLTKYLRRPRPAVYYVPAHRTLTLVDGYPPAFQQFRPETPYVVRQFSEALRQILIEGTGHSVLFPQAKRLKSRVRDKINDAVFHGAQLREDTAGLQRQLRLRYPNNASLPYMTWTAGQREFIPLLLGLYYLLPAGRYSKRTGTDWVIVEEPEMGLHPMAIMAVMLLVLDLMSRGYKVILSTHSPLVLDVVWALGALKNSEAQWGPVLKLFGIEGVSKASARGEVQMAEAALKKSYRVHLFKIDANVRVTSRDISSLDPGSTDPEIAGWGGLTGITGQIGDVVSRAASYAHHGRTKE